MTKNVIEILQEAFAYSWGKKTIPSRKQISSERLDLLTNIFKSFLQAWFVAIGSLYTSVVYFKFLDAVSILIYLIIGLTGIIILLYKFLRTRAFAKMYNHIITTIISNGILALVLFLITLKSKDSNLAGQQELLFVVTMILFVLLWFIVNKYVKHVK